MHISPTSYLTRDIGSETPLPPNAALCAHLAALHEHGNLAREVTAAWPAFKVWLAAKKAVGPMLDKVIADAPWSACVAAKGMLYDGLTTWYPADLKSPRSDGGALGWCLLRARVLPGAALAAIYAGVWVVDYSIWWLIPAIGVAFIAWWLLGESHYHACHWISKREDKRTKRLYARVNQLSDVLMLPTNQITPALVRRLAARYVAERAVRYEKEAALYQASLATRPSYSRRSDSDSDSDGASASDSYVAQESWTYNAHSESDDDYRPSYNPANGFSMVGGVDVCGNAYGSDNNHY